MSLQKIKYTARVLLLLYIGYFGCVSYFIHSHVYNGVVYVHSHPYNKLAKDTETDGKLPFETHHHTSAGFFTYNQISNLTSLEAAESINIGEIFFLSYTVDYKEYLPQIITRPTINYFQLRAPPYFA